MRIAEVIGRVTLSRQHPALKPGTYLIGAPLPLEAILAPASGRRGEELVVFDVMGASMASLIGVSEGREAANPFGKTKVPIDAYCACLLDQIDVERP